MPSLTSHGPRSAEAVRPPAELWRALPHYAPPEEPPTPAEAHAYCERLARTHYENFSVVTWALPRRLRPHFYSVYAYCRIADDLGDETGDAQLSLQLLDAWEAELDACYAGAPRHPVFVALAETVAVCGIPRQPFADLLTAFRRDQFVTRYESFEDLLGYCRYSADPVGRLVLYICGYSDPERQKLSDCTCTALQLANFWQDVRRDHARGRVYLPQEDLRQFGLREKELERPAASPEFVAMMRFEVERARDWFERGLPLIKTVDRPLATDIELFSRGGLEILSAIERQGYDVLKVRPTVPKRRKLALLVRAIAGRLL
jgi:squalene synthase HpnC